MRPVTDKHNISRAKLAYLIDATAAPVCIIAPISSWAAAVSGFAQSSDTNGLSLFIHAIPYNFYALLTIVMMISLTLSLIHISFPQDGCLALPRGTDVYRTSINNIHSSFTI